MSLVTTEDRGAVRIVIYANPPFGTMTAAGSNEMYDIVVSALADAGVRTIVITGGLPGIFIRHYDVGELSVMSDALADLAPPPPQRDPGPRTPGFLDLTDLIAAADKPVIAAINGLCMGGGFELSLACDLRIAGEDVTAIGLPETRIGIFPRRRRHPAAAATDRRGQGAGDDLARPDGRRTGRARTRDRA